MIMTTITTMIIEGGLVSVRAAGRWNLGARRTEATDDFVIPDVDWCNSEFWIAPRMGRMNLLGRYPARWAGLRNIGPLAQPRSG